MKILNLSAKLSFQSPNLFDKFANFEFLTISPIDDENLENCKFIKCEIGALNYVLAMLCAKFENNEFFTNLDIGFLSGESNVGEEEIDEIYEFVNLCDLIIVDENLLRFHKDAKNIESFLGILQNKFNLKIINLKNEEISPKIMPLSELKELDEYNGTVIFKHTQNSEFKGGKYFSMVAKIQNNDKVIIKTKNLNLQKTFILDENLKGTVAFLGVDEIFDYNFELAHIIKV